MTLRAAPTLHGPMYPESTLVNASGVFHESTVSVFVNGVQTHSGPHQISGWYPVGIGLAIGDVVTMAQSDGITEGNPSRDGLPVTPGPASLPVPRIGFPYSDVTHKVLVHDLVPGATLSLHGSDEDGNNLIPLADTVIDHSPMAVELKYNPLAGMALNCVQRLGARTSAVGRSSQVVPRLEGLLDGNDFKPLPSPRAASYMVGTCDLHYASGIQGAELIVEQDGAVSTYVASEEFQRESFWKPFSKADVSLVNFVSYRPSDWHTKRKFPTDPVDLFSAPHIVIPETWTQRLPPPVPVPYCRRHGTLTFTRELLNYVPGGTVLEVWSAPVGRQDWDLVILALVEDAYRMDVEVDEALVADRNIKARYTIGDIHSEWSEYVVHGPRDIAIDPEWADDFVHEGMHVVYEGQTWVTLRHLTPGSKIRIVTDAGTPLSDLITVVREVEHIRVQSLTYDMEGDRRPRQTYLVAEVQFCDRDTKVDGPRIHSPRGWQKQINIKRVLDYDTRLRLENCPPGMWCHVHGKVGEPGRERDVVLTGEAASKNLSIAAPSRFTPGQTLRVVCGFGGQHAEQSVPIVRGDVAISVTPTSAYVREIHDIVVKAHDPVEPERDASIEMSCQIVNGQYRVMQGEIMFNAYEMPDQPGTLVGEVTFKQYHPKTFSIPIATQPVPSPPPPQSRRLIHYATTSVDGGQGVQDVRYVLSGSGFPPNASGTLRAESQVRFQQGQDVGGGIHVDPLGAINVDGAGAFRVSGTTRVQEHFTLVDVNTNASITYGVNTGVMFVTSINGITPIAQNVHFNDDRVEEY